MLQTLNSDNFEGRGSCTIIPLTELSLFKTEKTQISYVVCGLLKKYLPYGTVITLFKSSNKAMTSSCEELQGKFTTCTVVTWFSTGSVSL